MRRLILLIAPALLMLAPHSRAENMDQSGTNIYVWSENAGWLNAQPQGRGGPGMQVNDFDITGWMWSENAGWINLSCRTTGTCGVVNFGVRNSGNGVLSGYAWSENAGWIDFGAAGAGVTIDPATGIFNGKAWSENLGWISFFEAARPGAFKLKTLWLCSPEPPHPTSSPLLSVTQFGSTTTLSWSATAGSTAFDVVQGDLAVLLSTGRFAAATQGCLADNSIDLTLSFKKRPAAGNGMWFLVRGVNCGGGGTYDEGVAGQVGPRDEDIYSSGNGCP